MKLKSCFVLLFFFLLSSCHFQKESSFSSTSSFKESQKEEIRVKVVYDAKEGKSQRSFDIFAYGEPFVLPDVVPDDPKDTFLGWYHQEEKIESSSFFPFKEDVTLTAKYKDNTFSFLLNMEDTYTLISYNGNEKNISLPSSYLGKKVTRIGKDAFRYSKIQQVNIPSSYRILKEGCFSFCTKLKKITLPTTLEKIEADAFYDDKNLKQVCFEGDISSYLKIEMEENASPFSYFASFYLNDVLLEEVNLKGDIHPYSFSHVVSLKKATISSKEIPLHAFSYCTNLKEVNLKDTESIDSYAFYNCQSLEDISFPSSLKEIQSYAFSKCLLLKEANLNEGLEVLSSYSFSENRKLEKINLPESLKEIQDHCFEGSASLKSILIKKNVSSLGIGLFSTCSSLASLQVEKENPYFESKEEGIYYKDDPTLLLFGCRKTVLIEGLKEIQREAFFGIQIEEITFPLSLETIGDYAFSNSALKELVFQKNLKNIGKNAFTGASKIEKIAVDENNPVYSSVSNCLTDKEKKTILYGCKTSKILEGIQTIEKEAFYFSSIEEASFPSSLKEIKERAFANCYSLKKVTSLEGLEKLGESAFSTCFSLKEASLPVSLKEIPAYAFEKCSLLSKVNLKGTERLSFGCFSYCDSLEEFSLPSSLKEIEPGSFMGSENILAFDTRENSRFTFEDNGLYDLKKENLYYGTSLFDACLPSLKNILEYAFYDNKIEHIHFNEGLENILDFAFCSSDLEEVKFPSSLKSIGIEAFSNCNSLNEISFDMEEEEFEKVSLGEASFLNCKSDYFQLKDKKILIRDKYKYDQ